VTTAEEVARRAVVTSAITSPFTNRPSRSSPAAATYHLRTLPIVKPHPPPKLHCSVQVALSLASAPSSPPGLRAFRSPGVGASCPGIIVLCLFLVLGGSHLSAA
jgi:hypothetical protein